MSNGAATVNPLVFDELAEIIRHASCRPACGAPSLATRVLPGLLHHCFARLQSILIVSRGDGLVACCRALCA
jgi:hypothetical protein